MEQKINNFTEGPILGPLLRFSLPVLLALLLQSLYGAEDLLIVGKFAALPAFSGAPPAPPSPPWPARPSASSFPSGC